MTELTQLLAMTFEGRKEWMLAHARFKQALQLWILRVDGHLVAMGTDEELNDCMLARLLMFLARQAMKGIQPR